MRMPISIISILAFTLYPHLLCAENTKDEALLFQESLTRITKTIQRFEEEIKTTPLTSIVKVSNASIENKTYADWIISRQNPTKYSSQELAVFEKIYPKVTDWIIEEYHKFYKEIYPHLREIARDLKDAPVRLGSVSVDIKPFGLGCSLSLDLNYDSPVFASQNERKKEK